MSRRGIISTRDVSPEHPLISAVDGNRKTGNGKATFKTATAAANAAKAAAGEAERQRAAAVNAACSALTVLEKCEAALSQMESRCRELDRAFCWVLVPVAASVALSLVSFVMVFF